MARTRKRTVRAAVGVATAALVVALGGCGGDGGDGGGDGGEASPTAEPTQTGAGSPSPSPTGSPTGTQVKLRSTEELGKILTDADGRTLYLFVADTSQESTCYDACAEAWPPLTVSGDPEAAQGVQTDLLGTTQRKDGSEQVTYDGHPLYYYENDDEPGDLVGQGLDQFGAKWWVLDASGNQVEGRADQEEEDEDRYGY